MIIDAHYHLDPRLESMERLLREMDRLGIDRVALIAAMVEPFRLGRAAHIVSSLIRRALLGRPRGLGRAMIRTTVTRDGHFSVLGKRYAIQDQVDNGTVRDAMAAHPARFLGWWFVNPAAGDPLPALLAASREPGWIGVKAHPFWHRYPVRLLDETAAFCVEKDWPLLIHLGADAERGDYRVLPTRHPRLRVLYAHAGVPFYRELWEALRDFPNAAVDLSGPYLDEPLRRVAVGALGPARCLFGSDGPYEYVAEDGGYDHAAILSEVDRLPVSPADRRGILGETFAGLIGRAATAPQVL